MKLGHGPTVGRKNATVSAVTVIGGTNVAATSGSSSPLDHPAAVTTATRAVTVSSPMVTSTPGPARRTPSPVPRSESLRRHRPLGPSSVECAISVDPATVGLVQDRPVEPHPRPSRRRLERRQHLDTHP